MNPPFPIGHGRHRQQHRRQPTQQELWSSNLQQPGLPQRRRPGRYRLKYLLLLNFVKRANSSWDKTNFPFGEGYQFHPVLVALALAAPAVCCLADRRQGSTPIPKPFTVGAIFRCKPIATCSSGPASLCPEQSPVSSWYQPAGVCEQRKASDLGVGRIRDSVLYRKNSPYVRIALPSAREDTTFAAEIDVTHFLPYLLSLQLPAPRELNPDLDRHIPDAQDPGHRLSPAGEP
ncbi:hypothetical protein I7I51_03124 [Histoplasma capsulatum]|uniref:Uncharacterized protein n=1 Tax=Ajellomyces capsulatus TaxID=5037 RepID=A0A8A1MQG3_AJECA|nr:hypothetical protein I7I51_03124 [Histoplasma capsulatum]